MQIGPLTIVTFFVFKRLRHFVGMRGIECFYSRSQHIRKFIETKESVFIREEFNSYRTGLGHQHGRRFISITYNVFII